MDDESKTTIAVVTSIIIGVVIITLSSLSYYSHKNELISGVIESGSHPIDARCAFVNANLSPICAVRAVK